MTNGTPPPSSDPNTTPPPILENPDNAWYRLDSETRDSIDSYFRHRRDGLVKVWSGVAIVLIGVTVGAMNWFWDDVVKKGSVTIARETAREEVRQFLANSKFQPILVAQANEVTKVATLASGVAAKAESDARRVQGLLEQLEKSVLPVLKARERQTDKQSANGGAAAAGKAAPPRTSIPAEAVLAFNRATCPPGWQEWDKAKGKMIIGVDAASRTPALGLLAIGGRVSQKLTINELPAHDHPNSTGPASGVLVWGQIGNAGVVNTIGIADSATRRTLNEHTQLPLRIKNQGGGKPFSNMPPYIALLLCKKNP